MIPLVERRLLLVERRRKGSSAGGLGRIIVPTTRPSVMINVQSMAALSPILSGMFFLNVERKRQTVCGKSGHKRFFVRRLKRTGQSSPPPANYPEPRLADRMTGQSCALLTLLASLAVLQHMTAAAAVDGVIIVRGNKLYNAQSGERFFIKGVRVYRRRPVIVKHR